MSSDIIPLFVGGHETFERASSGRFMPAAPCVPVSGERDVKWRRPVVFRLSRVWFSVLIIAVVKSGITFTNPCSVLTHIDTATWGSSWVVEVWWLDAGRVTDCHAA